VLALPIYPELNAEQQQRVIGAVVAPVSVSGREAT
jgi:dTDP-4-amino-4,6-dideoxygalactose transaminase